VFGGSTRFLGVLGLMLVNPALPNAYAVAGGTADNVRFLVFISRVVGI